MKSDKEREREKRERRERRERERERREREEKERRERDTHTRTERERERERERESQMDERRHRLEKMTTRGSSLSLCAAIRDSLGLLSLESILYLKGTPRERSLFVDNQ